MGPRAGGEVDGATPFQAFTKVIMPLAAPGVFTAAILVTIPIIVFVLIFQRRIVSGLTAGAVKG